METCNCTYTVGPHVKQEGQCPQTVPEHELCHECKCAAAHHEHKGEALLACSNCKKCQRFQAVIKTYGHRYAKREDIPGFFSGEVKHVYT